MRRPRQFAFAAALLAGVVAGLGLFTFVYGKGASYLVDDPNACVNCHVMRDAYDSWSAATHRTVTCNQCHVPSSLIGKYAAKASNGWWHSYAFTFKDVQTIRIKPANQRILQSNCAACHSRVVGDLLPHGAEPARYCVDCHRGAGHGF